MSIQPDIRVLAVLAAALTPTAGLAEGAAWESFLPFPASSSGRTEALAVYHQGTFYVLGGQPYRCPDAAPCPDPEGGAADYLPVGATEWFQGAFFDDGLQRLGGGVDGRDRPVAFGGAQFDDLEGNDRTFIYDIIEGDQTEPSLARRNFLHTHFAWATDDYGRLYAVGGGPGLSANAGMPNAADVERYDSGSDTWTVLAPMPEARAGSAAVYDGQGHILVFGGYDETAAARATTVLSYDIGNDSWSVQGELPPPPAGGNAFSDQRAVLGANGLVYVVGGINGPVGAGTTRAHVYRFDPVAATWGEAPSLLTPRHATALVLADDGWIYALGGRNGADGLISNERLDTSPANTECVTASDCDDGLGCNGDEFCIDGTCLPGVPVDCGVDQICTAGGICRAHRFDLVDLGALLGGVSGAANAINAAGKVVGEYSSPQDGQYHGFLYDGTMTDLGTGRAYAISDDGWIAGADSTAFAIDPNTGQRLDLGTLGGTGSAALGVANGGWVVGDSAMASGPRHAFLVRGPGAAMEDLGTLGDYSIAHGIDPLGMVIGESLVMDFDPHAEPFIFDSALAQAMMLPMGGVYAAGSGRAVNDLGQMTGWTSGHPDHWGHAFLYDGVEVRDLGAYVGKSYSIGTAINNAGQVVGYAFGEWVYNPCCPPYWSDGIHRAYFHDGLEAEDLNRELPEMAGWTLIRATGINDSGAITGYGNFSGQNRPFLLIPANSDQDSDGVPDGLDNCPASINPDQANSDGDGVGDACDNCLLVDNNAQRDTNADGLGNRCDADLNDDCAINFTDLGILKSRFFSADPDADLDGDGAVTFPDLALMKQSFFGIPGPSGLTDACVTR